MTVLVKIQDSSGVEVGSFTAEDNKGLAEMAAMHGIEILVSCNTGYCGVCLCDAQGDTQTLSIDKMGEHTFDLPLIKIKILNKSSLVLVELSQNTSLIKKSM